MSDALTEKVHYFRSDASLVGLSKYEEAELKPFHEKVRSRIHTVGDTEITYRVINHWAEKNILPEGCRSADASWRKFTTIELAWLRVIARLRDFGLSLERIASITEQVMAWSAETQSYTFFEYYFALALASNKDPYIVVLQDNTADVATTGEIESAKTFIGSQDMLLISLKSIVKEIGYEPLPTTPLLSLNKNEAVLVGKIRSDMDTEITTRIKDGEIRNIKQSVTYSENPSLNEIDKKFQQENAFGEILLKYADGKLQSAITDRNERLK